MKDESIWDRRSVGGDDTFTCHEDELERTTSMELRKHLDFALSPNTSEIRVFADKRQSQLTTSTTAAAATATATEVKHKFKRDKRINVAPEATTSRSLRRSQ